MQASPHCRAGPRLGSLAEARTEGLVTVAGRLLLAWVFESAVAAGADELVVVIGYEGAQIVDRFGDAFEGTPITYVHQRERRGLGHAVLQAEPYVEGDVLVVNGDNVFGESLAPAVQSVEQEGVDGMLGVEDVSSREASTTGVIVVEDGEVRQIVEQTFERAGALVRGK